MTPMTVRRDVLQLSRPAVSIDPRISFGFSFFRNQRFYFLLRGKSSKQALILLCAPSQFFRFMKPHKINVEFPQ